MTMTELLERVGNDHIKFQNLLESMENIQTRKDGSVAVTFLTSVNNITPNDVALGTGKHVGLVLWLPRERVDEAMKED